MHLIFMTPYLTNQPSSCVLWTSLLFHYKLWFFNSADLLYTATFAEVLSYLLLYYNKLVLISVIKIMDMGLGLGYHLFFAKIFFANEFSILQHLSLQEYKYSSWPRYILAPEFGLWFVPLFLPFYSPSNLFINVIFAFSCTQATYLEKVLQIQQICSEFLPSLFNN